MSSNQIVWRPHGYYATESNIAQFMRRNDIDEYDQVVPTSEAELARFWRQTVDDLGIVWEEPYDDVLDTREGSAFATWFNGGRLNATATLLDKWVERTPATPAYVWENEQGETETITYAQLDRQVGRAANALRDQGVGPGDVVGIVCSLHPVAMVTSLACFAIGAIQTHVFPGYGASAIAQRLADSEATIVVATDGYQRNGERIELVSKIDAAIAEVPTLETIVRYENFGTDRRFSNADDSSWDAFVSGHDESYVPTIVKAHEPALIAYSSGTTGTPKGTIHTQASLLANGMKEAAYQFDLSKGDTFLWVTDFGWVVVPAWMTCGAQALGATTVLIEGSPMSPSTDRLWRLVDEHDVTTLGMSPTGARQLKRANDKPRSDHSLASLRVLGSTGEPWDEDAWRWYFERVGDGHLPIINDSGGTEACGGLLAPTPKTPLKPCTLWGPAPGIPAAVYDDEGEPADEGYLVVAGPFPGMSRSLTAGDERYLEEYWEEFEDAWNQNDWVEIDEDGFWFITGRSDDTLNVSGRRITAPALEAAVLKTPGVLEAAVVPTPDDDRGEVPIAFIVTEEAVSADVEEAVQAVVAEHLGAPFRPAHVHEVSGLPRTQTGKVPRSVIESAYLGEPAGDVSSLDEGHVLETISELGK